MHPFKEKGCIFFREDKATDSEETDDNRSYINYCIALLSLYLKQIPWSLLNLRVHCTCISLLYFRSASLEQTMSQLAGTESYKH